MKLLLQSLCSRGMIICSSSFLSRKPLAATRLSLGRSSGSSRYFHRTVTSGGRTKPYMENTLEASLDWTDRIGLQDTYTLKEKGWEVRVDWRSTPYGAGLFAKEDIKTGTILRRGIVGINLKEFKSIADIDAFCRGGEGHQESAAAAAAADRPSDYRAKLEYVKDYLWGFNKDADERGYDKIGENGAPVVLEENRFFGMWVPGNGLNHNERPNTVYKPTPEGIDLVALTDIRKDDELFDDYRRHGRSSPWLKEFAIIQNVTLNFADCNDFV